MSCKEPNLQQLPRDVRYRRCFVAPPGRVLVKADYSQIELRIAARISGDKRMLAAYRDGEDLHTLTASAVLKKPMGEVTKADRQLAKAINFGLLYGMGSRQLVVYARTNYGVKLTEKRAAAHRDAFFATYPWLRRWHYSIPTPPIETRTLAGRRRLIQGTGADGLKRALGLLWERRDECPGAVPVLFVHDEVVVECDADRANTAAAWLSRAMVDGMTPLIAPVPVAVEVMTAPTWGG
jgi:DNA polymerase-1